MSPELAGGFSTTAPPGKPLASYLESCPPQFLLLLPCQSRSIQGFLTCKPLHLKLFIDAVLPTQQNPNPLPGSKRACKITTCKFRLLSFPTSPPPLWQLQTSFSYPRRPWRLPLKAFACAGTSAWDSLLVFPFSSPGPPPQTLVALKLTSGAFSTRKSPLTSSSTPG